MTLKNKRLTLLINIKLCASFLYHMWIRTGVMAPKRLSWVLTSVTLTFDLRPWPFAWTSLWSLAITPENFMMMQWREQGVTGRRADRQAELTIHRAAWSHLKSIDAYQQSKCHLISRDSTSVIVIAQIAPVSIQTSIPHSTLQVMRTLQWSLSVCIRYSQEGIKGAIEESPDWKKFPT